MPAPTPGERCANSEEISSLRNPCLCERSASGSDDRSALDSEQLLPGARKRQPLIFSPVLETLVSESTARTYRAHLHDVLDYIDAHLEEDLSVERLSSATGLSKFHFHRQFSAAFGIGVFRYVQLTRLKRAAYRLAFRDDAPVFEVALDSGYEGPEAFSRAFKKATGQSPSEFRARPDWVAWHETYKTLRELRMKHMNDAERMSSVQICNFPETKVATLEHRGSPERIGDSIRSFIAWRKENRLPPHLSATFNILYDDPEDTEPTQFRLDLCAAVEREIEPNEYGVIGTTIPAGRCAVLRRVGSEEGLGASIRWLYETWLPQSGEALRDVPPFVQRIKFFPDVSEHEATTDIFLPLR